MKCVPINQLFEEPYTKFSKQLLALLNSMTGGVDISMVFSTVCMTSFEKLDALAAVPEDSKVLIVTPELAVLANNTKLWPIVKTVVFHEYLHRSYSPYRLFYYSNPDVLAKLGATVYDVFRRKVEWIVEAIDNSINVEIYKNVPIPGVPYLRWYDEYLKTTSEYLDEVLKTAAKYGVNPESYLPYFPEKVTDTQVCIERAVAEAIGVSVEALRSMDLAQAISILLNVDVFKRIYDNVIYRERLVKRVLASELDRDSLANLLMSACGLTLQEALLVADWYIKNNEVVMEVYEVIHKFGPCEQKKTVTKIRCPGGGGGGGCKEEEEEEKEEKKEEEEEKKKKKKKCKKKDGEGEGKTPPPQPPPPPPDPVDDSGKPAGSGVEHTEIEFKLYEVEVEVSVPQPKTEVSPKQKLEPKWVER